MNLSNFQTLRQDLAAKMDTMGRWKFDARSLAKTPFQLPEPPLVSHFEGLRDALGKKLDKRGNWRFYKPSQTATTLDLETVAATSPPKPGPLKTPPILEIDKGKKPQRDEADSLLIRKGGKPDDETPSMQTQTSALGTSSQSSMFSRVLNFFNTRLRTKPRVIVHNRTYWGERDWPSCGKPKKMTMLAVDRCKEVRKQVFAISSGNEFGINQIQFMPSLKTVDVEDRTDPLLGYWGYFESKFNRQAAARKCHLGTDTAEQIHSREMWLGRRPPRWDRQLDHRGKTLDWYEDKNRNRPGMMGEYDYLCRQFAFAYFMYDAFIEIEPRALTLEHFLIEENGSFRPNFERYGVHPEDASYFDDEFLVFWIKFYFEKRFECSHFMALSRNGVGWLPKTNNSLEPKPVSNLTVKSRFITFAFLMCNAFLEMSESEIIEAFSPPPDGRFSRHSIVGEFGVPEVALYGMKIEHIMAWVKVYLESHEQYRRHYQGV